MIKIKEYKARKYAERGSAITIPSVYTDDMGIEPGDIIEIYREIREGKDVLVIFPKEKISEIPKAS